MYSVPGPKLGVVDADVGDKGRRTVVGLTCWRTMWGTRKGRPDLGTDAWDAFQAGFQEEVLLRSSCEQKLANLL